MKSKKQAMEKDKKLLREFDNSPDKKKIREIISDGLILSDLAGLLGDLLDAITEERVAKLLEVEIKEKTDEGKNNADDRGIQEKSTENREDKRPDEGSKVDS